MDNCKNVFLFQMLLVVLEMRAFINFISDSNETLFHYLPGKPLVHSLLVLSNTLWVYDLKILFYTILRPFSRKKFSKSACKFWTESNTHSRQCFLTLSFEGRYLCSLCHFPSSTLAFHTFQRKTHNSPQVTKKTIFISFSF